MDVVLEQMRQDKQDLNDEARLKKYKFAYTAVFHPDKMGRVEILEPVATKVLQSLEARKDWYLAP